MYEHHRYIFIYILIYFFQNIKLTDKNVIQNIKFICGKKPRLVGSSVFFSKSAIEIDSDSKEFQWQILKSLNLF